MYTIFKCIKKKSIELPIKPKKYYFKLNSNFNTIMHHTIE